MQLSKARKHNQGFSLIELLIALTILSIVMIMVVQFMSTSSAAYRKNEKNLNEKWSELHKKEDKIKELEEEI